MSANTINISLLEVKDTAIKINDLNQQLTERLNEIKKELLGLQSTWKSDAAETIMEKMNGMEPRFKEYNDVVSSYVTFLNDTVTAYEETESSINSYASSFN